MFLYLAFSIFFNKKNSLFFKNQIDRKRNTIFFIQIIVYFFVVDKSLNG